MAAAILFNSSELYSATPPPSNVKVDFRAGARIFTVVDNQDGGVPAILQLSNARPAPAIAIDESDEMPASSARKDLFIAVTLPLLGLGIAVFAAVAGSYAYTWSAFTRLDDSVKAVHQTLADQSKSQAVSAEQIVTLTKNSEESTQKMDKVLEQLNQMNATLLVLKSQKQDQR